MPAKVFNEENLKRYLDNIELAGKLRAQRVEDLKRRLDFILSEETKLREEIDRRMYTVNGMRSRRHNIIGVSWKIRASQLSRSFTQPEGPLWTKQLHARTGRRHLIPIKRPTHEHVKGSYQGKDAGHLRRLFKEIDALAERRDHLLRALTRTVAALKYVNPGSRTEEQSTDNLSED